MTKIFIGQVYQLIFFPVFIVFNDKIISAFADKNMEEFLLNQFKHVQEYEYGVNAFFTYFK